MDESEETDVSILTYEEWTRFFFRPPVAGSDIALAQFDLTLAPENTAQLIGYLTRLCRELASVIQKGGYTWPLVGQAIWGILAPGNCGCSRLLWQDSIEHPKRLECISSMYTFMRM